MAALLNKSAQLTAQPKATRATRPARVSAVVCRAQASDVVSSMGMHTGTSACAEGSGARSALQIGCGGKSGSEGPAVVDLCPG